MANMRSLTDGPQLFQIAIKKALDVAGQKYPAEFTHVLKVDEQRLGVSGFKLEIIANTVLIDHDQFIKDVMQTIHALLLRRGHIAVGFTKSTKGTGSVVMLPKAEYAMYWDRESRKPKKGYYNKYTFEGVIRRTD